MLAFRSSTSSLSPLGNYYVAAAAAAEPQQRPATSGAAFYAKGAVAGGFACWLSHVVVVPMDVVKTRMQLTPAVYPVIAGAYKKIWAEEGIRGMTLGWGPTSWGYILQGCCKYGFYEMFKVKLSALVGEERAHKHRAAVYITAGCMAEIIGDVVLTPFEAVRIRMVADPKFAKTSLGAIAKVLRTQGLATLYSGFPPLAMKQVPYTAVTFTVFELVNDIIYDDILKKTRNDLTKNQQLAVTATSGMIGGVCAALVSHPPDTILTKINVTEGGLRGVIKKLGFGGLWSGLGARLVMVSSLVCFQLIAYDAVKVFVFGLPTTEGIKKAGA